MRWKRVHFRLYPEDPDEAVVIEWLRSLPSDPGGRQRLKPHLLPILVQEARKQLRGSKKGSSPPATVRSKPEKALPVAKLKPAMPDFEEPAVAEPSSTNGGTMPTLPDFGA